MMLVGLTGPSGSRKTTVAKHLRDQHGFMKIHAGRPIKRAARMGFGLDKTHTAKKAKHQSTALLGGASPQSLMEGYGTITHQMAPKATAAHLHSRVMRRMALGKSVVVDGVRSPEEAAVIHKLGGQVWRVDGGHGPNPRLAMDQMQSAVESEHRLDSSALVNAQSSEVKKLARAKLRADVDGLVAKSMGSDFGHR